MRAILTEICPKLGNITMDQNKENGHNIAILRPNGYRLNNIGNIKKNLGQSMTKS